MRYISSRAMSFLNLTKSPIGRRVRDIEVPHAVYVEELKYITATIINTRTSSKYVLAWVKDSKVFLREHYASPIINDANDEVVGMYVEIRMFEPCETMNAYFSILNNKLHKKLPVPTADTINKTKIKLTSREYEVLFLVVLGKSQKEIADILSKVHEKDVKANSIASIISKQIYPKFEVHNLPNLVEEAIRLNMIDSFPQGLMKSLGLLNVEFEDQIANAYYHKLKESELDFG
jgi:hypothetical protein